MKKLMRLSALFLLIVMCFTVSASAAEEVDSFEEHTVIHFLDVDNNPDISVSDVMTFSEMVERYADNAGITYQEALEMFPNRPTAHSTNDIYYRVFTAGLNVSDEYKPHLEFYCETAEGGSFRNINSIYSVQLVRSYNGISKQFGGDIEVWLRNTYSIEYVVNGDFYNNGTTTVTGGAGVEIGLAESAKLTFSASMATSSNHYTYFYAHETAKYGTG